MREVPKIDRESVQATASISASGGDIVFTSRDPNDRAMPEALRAYSNMLVEKLRAGDLSPLLALFPADQQLVGGLRGTKGIGVVSNPEPTGFRISFTASDGYSRTAIHDFLQVPKAPENRSARHPGNNLGWDAQRQPDVDK